MQNPDVNWICIVESQAGWLQLISLLCICTGGLWAEEG